MGGTKRKAERHVGGIETHPDVGEGKAFRLVKTTETVDGHTWATLVRTSDKHEFTLRSDDFCDGTRPPEKLLYQYAPIVEGEFTVVDKADLQLTQGSGQRIKLVRTRDKHEFTMVCHNFCYGCRPPDSLLYQYAPIVEGEFTVVDKAALQLGQGSDKKVQLVRTRDKHEFTMRCGHFCLGKRPPERLLYQYAPIVDGEFTVVNSDVLQLSQGSAEKIQLVRTRDKHEFTMICRVFCNGSRPSEHFLYQYVPIKDGEFTVVDKTDLQLGQGSGKYIQLVRMYDGHQFTSRVADFCAGQRPPEKLLYQYAPIVDGEFTVDNNDDLQLGQGSHKKIQLVRTYDGHKFTTICQNFCLGSRPLEKFLYQYEPIVDGEFTVVDKADLQLGQGSNKEIQIVRTYDGHNFIMRCQTFCAGSRPPDRLLYQYGPIVDGEFTVVNKADLQLGQGSGQNILLVRTTDKHEFTMNCASFCRGSRPPDKLLYQYAPIVKGEFTVVDKADLQLGQGSGQRIKLVRTHDGHNFIMQCQTFCAGSRPPEKLLYQYAPIKDNEFSVIDKDDLQLGQGSGKKIELVRTRDNYSFTMRCKDFCRHLCWSCFEFTGGTYGNNLCASCWGLQHPGAALAVSAHVGNKTEILVAAMLRAHFEETTRVCREFRTRNSKREDVVLLSSLTALTVAIAIDGGHHFRDKIYQNGVDVRCADVQRTDTDKVAWWFADHPGCAYVRMLQACAWEGYPVNTAKPIRFDFVKVIMYIWMHSDKFANTVVFLEYEHRATLYDEHRRLLDEKDIKHVTLDPRTVSGPDLPDKRNILAQQ